jgi:hypothetical protein
MTTATQALAALKARAASGISFTVYWHGDDPPLLPDTPATFGFAIFQNEGSGFGPTAFGGGQSQNLYRNRGVLEVFVFSPPTGADGTGPVMTNAETVAARFRSYRDEHVSVDAADVIPVGEGSKISVPGMESAVSNYNCAVAEVKFHFNQIG